MLTRLRNNFGIPGLLAIAALVFAMIGGAYAASNGGDGKATASAKGKKGPPGKRGPRGPKGATGAAGAAGAQGPAGPAGAKGDTGAQGAAGATGKDGAAGGSGAAGASVVIKDATEFDCEDRGGILVEVQGKPETEKEVCNGEQGEDGKEGQPWTPNNTLPKGATLTGAWSFNSATALKNAYIPLSFPIKLKEGLEETKVHYATDANFTDFDEGGTGTVGCLGGAEDPTAPEGHLCVYEGFVNSKATYSFITSLTLSTSLEANAAGAILGFSISGEPAFGVGSWAVTGF